jgi:tRNA A37 methylthiotransferase MiaB
MPAVHAKSICRELITRDNPMPWTCYVNPLSFDDELAELMVQAGCVGMEVGSDSGCDDVLRSLRKGFTTAHIRQLHARAQDVGIADCHTFILGTEGETIEHARQTLDFIVDLDPFAAIIMIWVDDFEALDADYRAERQVLRESIMELLSDSAKAFPHWSIPSLGINFDETAFRIMREGGLRGPLWQYLRNRRERT